MTAGFQSFSTNGNVYQIDGTTPNFQLTATLTQTLQRTSIPTVVNNTGTQFFVTYWYTKFTFNATNPLYAFTADGNVMVSPWRFTQLSSNTYTAEFIGAAQTNIHLYIFDNVSPSASRFGLQVYSAAGVLIADAASPFSKMLDVQSGQYVSGTGYDGTGSGMPGTNTQQLNYGKNVAIAACFPAHYMFGTGDNQAGTGETTCTGIAVSGGLVTWEFHTFAGTRGDHFVGYREASYWRFMVLDMTGII